MTALQCLIVIISEIHLTMREQYSNVMDNSMSNVLSTGHTTRLLPLALFFMLCNRNNTDSNKLVIFSGIAYMKPFNNA